MLANDIIVELIGISGISKKRLAKTAGFAQPYFSKIERKATLSASTLVKICDALGYEVTVQPKKQTSGARPSNQYVVTAPTEEERAAKDEFARQSAEEWNKKKNARPADEGGDGQGV